MDAIGVPRGKQQSGQRRRAPPVEFLPAKRRAAVLTRAEIERGEARAAKRSGDQVFSIADECDLPSACLKLTLAFTRDGIHDPDLPLGQTRQPMSVVRETEGRGE